MTRRGAKEQGSEGGTILAVAEPSGTSEFSERAYSE